MQRSAVCGVLWLLATGCVPPALLITPVSGERQLREQIVRREKPLALRKIAVVDVDGVLSNARGGGLLGGSRGNPVAMLQEKLDLARRDELVEAIVLRINSPGGGVTASDLMYQALRDFRQRSGKPIIASFQDVAASGGYYIACAADRILANPTSVTGSIGVIMITPDVSGTMERIGVQANIIKSGPMKDAGTPLRPMKDDERAVMQQLVDAMYERFLAVVGESRKSLQPERIRTLADGRVYLAPQALEAGLIDQIGGLDDAIAAAKSAAGVDGPVQVVVYAAPAEYRANIFAGAPDEPRSEAELSVKIPLPAWFSSDSPQFLYLWAPAW